MKKLPLTRWLIAVLASVSATFASAQTQPAPAAAPAKPAQPISITLYGFVRNDLNYDSRQMNFVREGQLDLYPKDIDTVGMAGVDANKKSQLNILGILARLGVRVSGPDAFGAKTSAVLEGDFFGQAEANIGLLRLRHGYVKLDWKKHALTLGQTWYPLFIPECYPGVVNFNTGIPIAPFGWTAQIKYTAKFTDKFNASITAYKPREFSVASVNTSETTNSPSMNASIPELNAHVQYKTDKFMAGMQVDYSNIMPYVKYGTNPVRISKERVQAVTFMAYTKITGKKVGFKAMAVLGQNTTHWVMIGGYYGYKATPSSIETYKPAKTNAFWADVYGTGKKMAPGLFVGYIVNNGASAGATAAYGRMVGVSGRGIKDMWRVAPRLEIFSGKFRFGSELEVTSATYGTRGNNGKVTAVSSKDHITNVRLTFSTVFSF